jgi:hypothetical protein
VCYFNTGYTQKNGAVSKVNKKFISHFTRVQRTPSTVATVQVSHALPAVLFSCSMWGQFLRWRRSGKGVCSVLRCPDLWLQCSVSFVHGLEKTHRAFIDMDMSYARRVRTASHSPHTSYSVSRKALHQRIASHSSHTSHSVSHKWRHAAAAMRAHNVLCNSYNSITVEMNRCSFRRVRFVLLYIVTRSKIV